MPLPTLGISILPAGASAPDFAAVLQSLRESMQQIYGADVYIPADSQDGQLLALFAAAINDSNNSGLAVYRAFSPTFAQGVQLSSIVKINGIARRAASQSTAVGTVVGVVGTVIVQGVVEDEAGNLWDLPASVTIPISGEIQVTVTAQEEGAIIAPAGTINQIHTPIFGWQSFESDTDAIAGDPVETDAQLRQRQTQSTANPALTPLGALYGALANLAGVGRLRVYENYTNAPDSDGIPGHTICVVIQGGDLEEIAETIGQRKTPGAGTYGSTSQNYTDPVTGINYTINFYVLDEVQIEVAIVGDALPGYNQDIEDAIKAAIAEYLNGLDIGEDVDYTRMFVPAYLNNNANAQTYEITSLEIAIVGDSLGDVDIPIDFNEAAACDVADISIAITP